MKAIIYDHYGAPEVLHLAEVNMPKPQTKHMSVLRQAFTWQKQP